MTNRIKTKSQQELEQRKEHERTIAALYTRVFSTDEGQFVLDDILHRVCRVDDDFAGSDALATYRGLGRRSVGLDIKKKLKGQE